VLSIARLFYLSVIIFLASSLSTLMHLFHLGMSLQISLQ